MACQPGGFMKYINMMTAGMGSEMQQGNIQVNHNAFPLVLKALADYVHSKGV